MTEFGATSLDFRRALLSVRDSKSTRSTVWDCGVKMLQAQYRQAGRAITLAQLASSAKSTSANSARLQYDTFAQLVARELGYDPPTEARKPMWWMTIATCPPADGGASETEFTMRPELAEAIELMGWVKPH
jgi:hypothetical protein